MADRRPNLLFLMTDHQRADSLGMVRAGVEVTPNLNRLASQGTVFTRAYNMCPLCAPARTALFTGKYPTRNGVVFNDWAGETAGDHKSLHQYLAEDGYDVAQVGVDHIRLEPGLRERVRFATWVDNRDHRRYLEEQGLDGTPPEGREPFKTEIVEFVDGKQTRRAGFSNARTAVWPHSADHFKDMYWCRRAAELLSRPRTRPFALFLFLWAPHPPLWLPEPYASRFDPQRIELPPNVGVPAEGEPPGRRQGVAAQLAEGLSINEWRRAWAAHLGLVNLADTGLGMVLQALKDSGQVDNTIVLFTVDHGEHLGQHRMYQKMEMYEQAIRVPLIVRIPGIAPRSFDAPVSHLDVMPTLLELVGLEVPDDMDGIVLLTNHGVGTAAERPVFCQYSGDSVLGHIRRAVITRRYKYVYDPADRPELYDLAKDPLEMRNLAADPAHAALLGELHQQCASWHECRGDWVEF